MFHKKTSLSFLFYYEQMTNGRTHILRTSVLTMNAENDEMEVAVEILGGDRAESSEYFYLVIEPTTTDAAFKVSSS